MNKALQNKLYEKYPEIFAQKDLDKTQTLMCWGISCGDGWYNIIDMLCENLQNYCDAPHKDIVSYERWLAKAKEDGDELWAKTCEERLAKAIQTAETRHQVQAVQVKEKYGTLRFYTDHYDDIIRTMVDFAEDMSGCTCENCGAPGQPSKSGWIKVQCNRCTGDI